MQCFRSTIMHRCPHKLLTPLPFFDDVEADDLPDEDMLAFIAALSCLCSLLEIEDIRLARPLSDNDKDNQAVSSFTTLKQKAAFKILAPDVFLPLMHWSFALLFLYIVLSQHAFLTVFSDSSQLPVARTGDLGIFRLFSVGIGLLDLEIFKHVGFTMQADIESLLPGAVVLYKTNESENGLKLATNLEGSSNISNNETWKQLPVLHLNTPIKQLSKNRLSERVLTKEVGILLRRWGDACNCGDNYADKPRDFIKPVSDIHGVLWISISWLGLPILLLHRLKIFLAGAGLAGGGLTVACSLIFGQHISLYDLDLDTRGTPRRRSFVIGSCLLCTIVAYLVYKLTVPVIGVTCTTGDFPTAL